MVICWGRAGRRVCLAGRRDQLGRSSATAWAMYLLVGRDRKRVGGGEAREDEHFLPPALRLPAREMFISQRRRRTSSFGTDEAAERSEYIARRCLRMHNLLRARFNRLPSSIVLSSFSDHYVRGYTHYKTYLIPLDYGPSPAVEPNERRRLF